MELVLKLIMVLLAVFLVVIIYSAATTETFSLAKNAWVCTKSHTGTLTTYMQVGRVQVPQFHPQEVCDQWVRKGY